MGTSYHQEALRKQRMLERSHAALERIRGGNGNTFGQKDGSDYVSPLTISQPESLSKEPVHTRYKFNAPGYPIRHRRVDNSSEDQILQFMKPEYKNYKLPKEDLPPRRTHVKV